MTTYTKEKDVEKQLDNAFNMWPGAGEFMKGSAYIGSKTYDTIGAGNRELVEQFKGDGEVYNVNLDR